MVRVLRHYKHKTVLVWGQSHKCSYICMYKYTYKFLTVRVVLCKLFVSEYRGFWEFLAVVGRYSALCFGITRTILSHSVAEDSKPASLLCVIPKMSKVQK